MVWAATEAISIKPQFTHIDRDVARFSVGPAHVPTRRRLAMLIQFCLVGAALPLQLLPDLEPFPMKLVADLAVVATRTGTVALPGLLADREVDDLHVFDAR